MAFGNIVGPHSYRASSDFDKVNAIATIHVAQTAGHQLGCCMVQASLSAASTTATLTIYDGATVAGGITVNGVTPGGTLSGGTVLWKLDVTAAGVTPPFDFTDDQANSMLAATLGNSLAAELTAAGVGIEGSVNMVWY